MLALEQTQALSGRGPSQMFYRMCLTPQESNLWKTLHDLAKARQVRRGNQSRYDVALPNDADELNEFLTSQGISQTDQVLAEDAIHRWKQVSFLQLLGSTSADSQSIYSLKQQSKDVELCRIEGRIKLEVPEFIKTMIENLCHELFFDSWFRKLDITEERTESICKWLREFLRTSQIDGDVPELFNRYIRPIGKEFGWRLLSLEESSGALVSCVPGFTEVELEAKPEELKPEIKFFEDEFELMPGLSQTSSPPKSKSARRRTPANLVSTTSISAPITNPLSASEVEEMQTMIKTDIERLTELERMCAETREILARQLSARQNDDLRRRTRARIAELARSRYG